MTEAAGSSAKDRFPGPPPALARRFLDGATLRRTACGEGEMVWRSWGHGKPLLLVHGGAGSWTHWIRNLEPLAGGRRVIAPDIPGLGESADPPRPYTPESIAAIIAKGLTGVVEPHERLDVAGFSFGGMISGLVAREVAKQVDSITLIGASGLGGRFDGSAPVRKLPPGGAAAALREVHVHNLASLMLHAPTAIDDLAIWIQATNAPRTRVMSPEHALSRKLEEALRELDVPIVSIWGEHCIFQRDLERRRALLTSIRPDHAFYRVPAAGHWVQYEAAATVNRILAEHLLAAD